MKKHIIKKPLTKGVARVPVVMQLEALECGAAALCMIMAYYEKWVPLEQVRVDCGVSRDGSNAGNIYQAAERYGFKVQAKFTGVENLKEKGTFPCIIHWNMNHFVVLDGFRGKYAVLNDPADGVVRVDMEEFSNSFTGVVIYFEPGKDFQPGGKPRSILSFARKRLIGTGAAVAFVILTTAISYLFGITNSVTSRIFMDELLIGKNPDWFYPFIIILCVLAALQLAVAWVQAVNSLKLKGKMAAAGSSAFMWKVLRMPMDFFSQRMAGDIQGRLEQNATIAETMVNIFAPIALNLIIMVLYLTLMLRQSVLLTALGMVTLVVNIVMSRIIAKKRVNITRVQQRDESMLWGTTVAGIAMVETLKASGAEYSFFQKWSGYEASVNNQKVKAEKMQQFLGSIPVLIGTLVDYGVLVLGVMLIIEGRQSLGGVMMFQGLLWSFMDPALLIVQGRQTLQEMRTSMERVEDVMEYHDDPGLQETPGDGSGELNALQGNLELKNVTFGYSRLAEPLIENFSLKLKTGQRIALVGASGSGKSTISRLVSGLYQPWSGEILFDGKPRAAYPHDVMVSSVAVVDQDITIFDDTISDNIKMWDDSIMDFEVILAARDAQIHDDIMKMSGAYQHRLSNAGADLSGGQRQRLEIARVLAQDPSLIILDEATSALDAQTESDVMKAVKDRGITCIMIAHRLSTVRDCDEIIVLDHGKVVQRGTHAELMAAGGAYADLVAND